MKISSYHRDKIIALWKTSNRAKPFDKVMKYMTEYYKPVPKHMARKVTTEDILEVAKRHIFDINPFQDHGKPGVFNKHTGTGSDKNMRDA